MKTFIFTILFLLISIISFSCKEDSPTIQSEVLFEGITETSEKGPEPIGNIDPDDWKPLMNCFSMPKINSISDSNFTIPKCTQIFPAYPNPTNKQFVIHYNIATNDSVVIVLNKTSTTVVKNVLNQKALAGSYNLFVDGSDLTPGIYRVYFSVHSADTVLSTYGDVQIQN